MTVTSLENSALQFTYQTQAPGAAALGALVVFLPEDGAAAPAHLPAPLRQEVRRVMELKEFQGKRGQSRPLFPANGPVARLLLVGTGKAQEFTRELLRRAAGSAAKQLAELNLEHAGTLLPAAGGKGARAETAGVVAEGMLLGAYRFRPYMETPREEKSRRALKRVTLYDPGKVSGKEAMQRGVVRAEAMCLTRTLG